MSAKDHDQDIDCRGYIDPETLRCKICHVDHGDQCHMCIGRGYHTPECPLVQDPPPIDLPLLQISLPPEILPTDEPIFFTAWCKACQRVWALTSIDALDHETELHGVDCKGPIGYTDISEAQLMFLEEA